MLDGTKKLTLLLKPFDELPGARVTVLEKRIVEQFSSTGQLATFGLADLAIGTKTELFTIHFNSTTT